MVREELHQEIRRLIEGEIVQPLAKNPIRFWREKSPSWARRQRTIDEAVTILFSGPPSEGKVSAVFSQLIAGNLKSANRFHRLWAINSKMADAVLYRFVLEGILGQGIIKRLRKLAF